MRRDEAQREQLLRTQLDRSVASISNPQAAADLLATFAGSDVRFKGYVRDNPKLTLEGVVRRGGVFTLAAGADASRQKHGSLLHSRGIAELTDHSGRKDAATRELLSALRDAVRDYASLYDALAIVGNRRAYLISVNPTVTAHEEAVKKLLEHTGNPVFVPRPPPRLFDAVDPSEGGGGADSNYELHVPLPFYWRQVGRRDRGGLDPADPLPSERMKWARHDKNAKVSWEQISVPVEKGGFPVPSASFDVAVQLPDHVVLFRNQNHIFGLKREVVEKQARRYVDGLGITVPQGDEVVHVKQGNKGQFVGSLLYATLANSFADGRHTSKGDVELLSNAAFAQLRKAEGER